MKQSSRSQKNSSHRILNKKLHLNFNINISINIKTITIIIFKNKNTPTAKAKSTDKVTSVFVCLCHCLSPCISYCKKTSSASWLFLVISPTYVIPKVRLLLCQSSVKVLPADPFTALSLGVLQQSSLFWLNSNPADDIQISRYLPIGPLLSQ